MNFATLTATFTGSATSAAIDLGRGAIIAIVPDGAFTGTSLGIQATLDGTNYYDVYDETGTQLAYTVATATYTIIPPSKAVGLDLIKLVSDQSETATIQILIK